MIGLFFNFCTFKFCQFSCSSYDNWILPIRGAGKRDSGARARADGSWVRGGRMGAEAVGARIMGGQSGAQEPDDGGAPVDPAGNRVSRRRTGNDLERGSSVRAGRACTS
jgi:hypothetical protein